MVNGYLDLLDAATGAGVVGVITIIILKLTIPGIIAVLERQMALSWGEIRQAREDAHAAREQAEEARREYLTALHVMTDKVLAETRAAREAAEQTVRETRGLRADLTSDGRTRGEPPR